MPNTEYKRLDDDGLLYLLTLLEPVIAAAGEANVIEVIQKNGVNLTIQGKTVDIPVPTDADIEALITAHGYQTASDVSTAIDSAIADITQFDFDFVDELPSEGVKGIIYLVPIEGATDNSKEEYIWIEPQGEEARFEPLGSTKIDLSGYVQASEMHALTNSEIDTIFSQVFGS